MTLIQTHTNSRKWIYIRAMYTKETKQKKKSQKMNYDGTNMTLGVFGLSLFLLKLKTETENTVAK